MIDGVVCVYYTCPYAPVASDESFESPEFQRALPVDRQTISPFNLSHQISHVPVLVQPGYKMTVLYQYCTTVLVLKKS
jgi:hypothetical protein